MLRLSSHRTLAPALLFAIVAALLFCARNREATAERLPAATDSAKTRRIAFDVFGFESWEAVATWQAEPDSAAPMRAGQ